MHSYYTQMFKFLQNLKSAILYFPKIRKSPTTFVTPLGTLGVLNDTLLATKQNSILVTTASPLSTIAVHSVYKRLVICRPSLLSDKQRINYVGAVICT